MASLKTKMADGNSDFINLKIRKKDLEAFCSSVGLYTREFISALDASAEDHRKGRVKSRNRLSDILSE